MRRKNEILKRNGDILYIDISTKLHQCAEMVIESIDWNYLLRRGVGRVSAVSKGNKVYAQAFIGRFRVSIHKLLMPYAIVVDHKNGNGIDNRRSNLRPCTYSQNNMNSSVRSHNKTGVKGVSFEKRTGRFYSRIRANGICRYLGTFDTIEEASEAYNNASIEMHGEFAHVLNK